MKRSYDLAQSFKVLIHQNKDAVDFASIGNAAYFSKQIVIITYNLIFQTGFFKICLELYKTKADKKHELHLRTNFHLHIKRFTKPKSQCSKPATILKKLQ